MEKWIHRYLMHVFQATLAILLVGSVHAEEGIRIIAADPSDNVLLEISTDTPRAVMSSSDLETWSYVFHYLPSCQNFKAYAPQKERKQTFFKLAPVHPEYTPLLLDTDIPSLEGKAFWSLGWVFSFSEGGIGTVTTDYSDAPDFENSNYSVVDSRPGMVSVRTWVADGHKRDHLILIPAPDAPAQFNDAVAFTADRFGDIISRMWTDGIGSTALQLTSHYLGPERPQAPSTMPDAVGLMVELTDLQANISVVTLGPNGTASVASAGNTETASYDYVVTGPTRATLRISKMDGTKVTAFLRIEGSYSNYQTVAAAPYSVAGYGAVRLIPPTDGDGG